MLNPRVNSKNNEEEAPVTSLRCVWLHYPCLKRTNIVVGRVVPLDKGRGELTSE